MEKKIKDYEHFIAKETKKNLTDKERAELTNYHREMLTNFQRERLIHLIIMLFFVAIALILVGLLLWSFYAVNYSPEMIIYYILTAIVVILAIAYVKHYYFLENHIQALYHYTELLMTNKNN